jgi:hypothetical protein
MKNLIVIIFALLLSANIGYSQCAAGGSMFPIFTQMNGMKPTAYRCDTFKSNMLSGQLGVPLTTGSSSCPGGTCFNPGFFAPYYETYQFKNTLLTPQCVRISWTAVQAAGCQITFAYTGTGPVLLWTPAGAPCYTAPINMGSPGAVCMGAGQSYQLEIPPCSAFTVFLGNNNGARGTYNLNITTPAGGVAAIGCLTAECKKLLVIGGTPVPTMTQWGLFLFGLIILTFASVAVYNFTQRASVKQ